MILGNTVATKGTYPYSPMKHFFSWILHTFHCHSIKLLEDGIPLEITIEVLFSNQVRKIYQMSGWTNCKVQIK